MQAYSKKHKSLKKLFDHLTDREEDVLISRYGLFGNKKETLEEIGSRYSLTRERVRQLQTKILQKLRKNFLCPIPPNLMPQYFTGRDNRVPIYLLSADICRIKYRNLKINKIKVFIEPNIYEKFLELKKYTKELPDSMHYLKKMEEIFKYGQKIEIPLVLIKKHLNEFKAKRNNSDRIAEVLGKMGYPMHYSEVHKILSKTYDIGLQRNVLATMQRRGDLFVRVENGVYALKSEEFPESVAFIKDLIIEYLNEYKEGSPMQIYNWILDKRQCSYSSIPMYLSFDPKFEEIRSEVYSLRDSKKKNSNDLNLDDIFRELLKNKEYIPISDFIGEVQRKLPELTMDLIYEYLENKSGISVQDNFILKK